MNTQTSPTHPFSEYVNAILDRMEPDCPYEPQQLRALVPDISIEHLREIMHELWVNRHVERAGESGWRRHRSAPPHVPRSISREIQAVNPAEVFDHAALANFFK